MIFSKIAKLLAIRFPLHFNTQSITTSYKKTCQKSLQKCKNIVNRKIKYRLHCNLIL